MPDSQRIWDLLMKVDSKVDSISESLPTYATKQEHSDLRDIVNDFMSRVKAVGWIVAISGSAKAAWTYFI